jgi:hypothetical protein
MANFETVCACLKPTQELQDSFRFKQYLLVVRIFEVSYAVYFGFSMTVTTLLECSKWHIFCISRAICVGLVQELLVKAICIALLPLVWKSSVDLVIVHSNKLISLCPEKNSSKAEIKGQQGY